MTIPLRSRATGSAIGFALALSVSGCSVHPLPDDLSPASTVDIVKRIRCEAWEGMTGFRPHEREKVDKIIGATKIGYDVVFSITEQNAAGGGKLEFDRPSFKGKGNGFSLDLSASADASRTNKRSFRFVDKLSELRIEGEKSCRGPARAENLLYPITGATGMGELVRTYIKLEMLTELGSEKSQVFSDELRFITNLRAGALPTLELSTVAGDFRLSHLETHRRMRALFPECRQGEPPAKGWSAKRTNRPVRDAQIFDLQQRTAHAGFTGLPRYAWITFAVRWISSGVPTAIVCP